MEDIAYYKSDLHILMVQAFIVSVSSNMSRKHIFSHVAILLLNKVIRVNKSYTFFLVKQEKAIDKYL